MFGLVLFVCFFNVNECVLVLRQIINTEIFFIYCYGNFLLY